MSLWLISSAIGPDAYSRLVDAVKGPVSYRRLARHVRVDTGYRPGRRFKRWLRREETLKLLVARRQKAYTELVDSLADAEAMGRLRVRTRDPERAAELVRSTIRHFLQVLDPSLATAITDHRSEERHAEVLERLDASSAFESNLALLPPPARELLANLGADNPAAARLGELLAQDHPEVTVRGLCEATPDWLADGPLTLRLVLAEAAVAYGLHEQAAAQFQLLAGAGLQRAHNLARAALELHASEQPTRATHLMEQAEGAGSDLSTAMIGSYVRGDWSGLLDATGPEAIEEPLMANLYAAALQATQNSSAAIALLRRVADAHPDRAATRLMLSRLYLSRAGSDSATSREQDLREALEYAIAARDARRTWRGDSAEAVHLACVAALLAGDFDRVVALGTAPPRGQATSREATHADVVLAVAQAAVAQGDLEIARSAATHASGFHAALITADLLVAEDAPQAELTEAYELAWELATDEEQQVDLWLAAAEAGIEPPPGAEELNRRTDTLPTLVRASTHLARQRPAQAIEILRPLRDNESARRLLARAYVESGDVDAAVAELVDMANRYNDPRHLVGAMQVLLAAGRLTAAGEMARTALVRTVPGSPQRDLLHEVIITHAADRGDWREVTALTRAWIAERGATHLRSWMLVQALLNQADYEAAWRVLQEHQALDPVSPGTAEMWIALHARFNPTAETLSHILELTRRFPDEPSLRARAVNAYFLMGVEKEMLPEAERQEWAGLVEAHDARESEDDFFESITAPTTPEELAEVMRPYLEPQARRIEEWLQKVRDQGWPYGMLAMAARRPYAAALIHRAAGCLPVASGDDRDRQAGQQSAIEALEGRVIVDLSSLAIAWYVRDWWPVLSSAFTQLSTQESARGDVLSTLDAVLTESVGSLSWDIHANQPVLHETDPAEVARLKDHATWLNERVLELPWEHTRNRGPTNDSAPTEPFQEALAIAKSSGLPLWCDDLGLRALARNEGVAAFSTLDLVDALVGVGRLSSADRNSISRALRDEYCVDLPLDHEWLVRSAQAHDWNGGPAVYTFARPSLWRSDLSVALEGWRSMARMAGQGDPENVAPWIWAAATALRHVDQTSDGRLVGLLLVEGAVACGFDSGAFVDCARALTQTMTELRRPDPVEGGLEALFEVFEQQHDPAEAATRLAQLGSELEGGHREALRRVLFSL